MLSDTPAWGYEFIHPDNLIEGGILYQLFVSFFHANELSNLLLGKNVPKIVDEFKQIALHLKMKSEADALQLLMEHQTSNEGWNSNEFKSEDLSVYNL